VLLVFIPTLHKKLTVQPSFRVLSVNYKQELSNLSKEQFVDLKVCVTSLEFGFVDEGVLYKVCHQLTCVNNIAYSSSSCLRLSWLLFCLSKEEEQHTDFLPWLMAVIGH
jgi:hypothetical protein